MKVDISSLLKYEPSSGYIPSYLYKINPNLDSQNPKVTVSQVAQWVTQLELKIDAIGPNKAPKSFIHRLFSGNTKIAELNDAEEAESILKDLTQFIIKDCHRYLDIESSQIQEFKCELNNIERKLQSKYPYPHFY